VIAQIEIEQANRLARSQAILKQVILNARNVILNVQERSCYFVMLTQDRLKFTHDRQAVVKL
jgi:hypothetical protein